MNHSTLFIIIGVIILIAVVTWYLWVGNAFAYMKVHFPKTALIGSRFMFNGTSVPSNASHTSCEVLVRQNGSQYAQTNGTGVDGTFTSWSFKSFFGETVKPGVNPFELKYECFPPGGNQTVPNLTAHHSFNITGVK